MIDSLNVERFRIAVVRRALHAYGGKYDLSRNRVKDALDSHRDATREKRVMREELLSFLHSFIGSEKDGSRRSKAIQLRRDVFNDKPIEIDTGLGEIGHHIHPYRLLATCQVEAERVVRESIADLKNDLQMLAADPIFSFVLEYSAPLLAKKRERARIDAPTFTRRERTIHSYATKMFSKPAPFFLFGSIAILDDPELRHNRSLPMYELHLDVDALQVYADSHLHMSGNAYLSLQPWFAVEHGRHFLVKKGRGYGLIHCKSTPIVDALVHIWQTSEKTSITERWLLARLRKEYGDSKQSRREIQDTLKALSAAGILAPRLVQTLYNLRCPQGGFASDTLSQAQELHGLRFDEARLAEIQVRVQGATRTWEGHHKKPPFFINTYSTEDSRPLENILEEVQSSLVALSPLFSLRDNWYLLRMRIREYFLTRLGTNVKMALPEALQALLSGFPSLLESLDATASNTDASAFRLLSEEEGYLSEDRLCYLKTRLSPRPSTFGLSVSGSFDLEERSFTLHHIFPRFDRYRARYGARNPIYLLPHGEPDPIQLLFTYPGNKNHVSVMYEHVLSFDSRVTAGLSGFVDPSDIIVTTDASGPRFFNSKTTREVSFRFCGFLIADYMPLEYKLLLCLDHCDYFENFFARRLDHALGSADVVTSEGLRYNNVVLRRRAYIISRRWLLRSGIVDPGRFCFQLYDDIVTSTSVKETSWFYEGVSLERNGHKPRLLDLSNMASVQEFVHDLSRFVSDGVRLTPTRPQPAGMFKNAGSPYATECILDLYSYSRSREV